MDTITLPRQTYKTLLKRQERTEKELETIKDLIKTHVEDLSIRPAALKRWERISGNIDRGRGRSFTSVEKMRKWLARL